MRLVVGGVTTKQHPRLSGVQGGEWGGGADALIKDPHHHHHHPSLSLSPLPLQLYARISP